MIATLIFNLIIMSILLAFSIKNYISGEYIKAIYVLLLAFFEFYFFVNLQNLKDKK